VTLLEAHLDAREGSMASERPGEMYFYIFVSLWVLAIHDLRGVRRESASTPQL